MDLGQQSRNCHSAPSSASLHKKIKLSKLRKSVNAVRVVRLLKSMRRLCVDPAAVGVEPGPTEISTGPRKAEENLNGADYDQYEYSQHLKLMFSNNINGPIYTGLPVGEEGSTLHLHLIDSHTQNIVKSGPEASAKVEIVALEKDEIKTATSWPGGKSLIRGDPHVILKDGSVSVGHISFKHTRVPMKKRELTLRARALYTYDIGTRIMDAVSEPFIVKDRRCMSKSLKPLALDDEVWKLQTIGKGGAFHDHLLKENIKTVRDFLTHYFLNRDKLLSIPGRRMHAKKLDEAVNQAKSKLDLKKYLYNSAHPQENVRVVFTDVGELIGLLYKESQFASVEQLTPTQKVFGVELVRTAFQDGHQNFKVLDDDSFELFSSTSTPNVVCPVEAADFDCSNGFSFEAYCPIDMQQHPVASTSSTFMPSTSTATNNYDSISQINSSATLTGALPDCADSYDNDFTNQRIWDYEY
ncbi:calmodulin-binding protein 60 B isoform X1 [Capsicum annuum]|nr:calmodulin-binding protein 60 B isoform X1 [Capsicum annuum]